MGVELHGMAHDIRHFVVSAVIHALHRVHDASLYRFEAVFNIRDGTLQDYV